jgi:hypothetical protein
MAPSVPLRVTGHGQAAYLPWFFGTYATGMIVFRVGVSRVADRWDVATSSFRRWSQSATHNALSISAFRRKWLWRSLGSRWEQLPG